MKVYSVNAKDGDPAVAFATKGAALKEARIAAAQYCPVGETVEVEEEEVVPITKAVVVRLINGDGGWCTNHRVIATFPSKRKEEA